jgi:hypothetical protein
VEPADLAAEQAVIVEGVKLNPSIYPKPVGAELRLL